jgi:hypothetical protein
VRAAILGNQGAGQVRMGAVKIGPQTGQSLTRRRQVHLPFRKRSRSTLATSPQAITSGLAANRYSSSVLPLWL